MYIGHSLSQCVANIVDGVMPLSQVSHIECGTMIPSFKTLEQMIEDNYFGNRDSQLVLEVCEYLLFRGLFVQPRLMGRTKELSEIWIETDCKTSPSTGDPEHSYWSNGQWDVSQKFYLRLIAKIDAHLIVNKRVDQAVKDLL